MSISIVMLHYGRKEITESSLLNLKKRIDTHSLILINNTKEDIFDLAKIIPTTKLINNSQNLGFAKAINQGIKEALKNEKTTHILLLNNDLHFAYGSPNQLIIIAKKLPQAGIVAPVLHHSKGYDWGGKYNPWIGMVHHKNWPNKPKTIQPVDHVAAAAILIPRSAIEKVGLFDESYFLYFEDLDFCLRLKSKGYTINLTPDVVVEHAVSASSSSLSKHLHLWRSHLVFLIKNLPIRAYPTAIIYDAIFYPLILIKILLQKALQLK